MKRYNALYFFQNKTWVDDFAMWVGRIAVVVTLCFGLKEMMITQVSETGTQTEFRSREKELEEQGVEDEKKKKGWIKKLIGDKLCWVRLRGTAFDEMGQPYPMRDTVVVE